MSDDVDKAVAWDTLSTSVELVRSAFLRYLQSQNMCKSDMTGKPCHSHKCGCAIEMQNYIDEARAPVGGVKEP